MADIDYGIRFSAEDAGIVRTIEEIERAFERLKGQAKAVQGTMLDAFGKPIQQTALATAQSMDLVEGSTRALTRTTRLIAFQISGELSPALASMVATLDRAALATQLTGGQLGIFAGAAVAVTGTVLVLVRHFKEMREEQEKLQATIRSLDFGRLATDLQKYREEWEKLDVRLRGARQTLEEFAQGPFLPEMGMPVGPITGFQVGQQGRLEDTIQRLQAAQRRQLGDRYDTAAIAQQTRQFSVAISSAFVEAENAVRQARSQRLTAEAGLIDVLFLGGKPEDIARMTQLKVQAIGQQIAAAQATMTAKVNEATVKGQQERIPLIQAETRELVAQLQIQQRLAATQGQRAAAMARTDRELAQYRDTSQRGVPMTPGEISQWESANIGALDTPQLRGAMSATQIEAYKQLWTLTGKDWRERALGEIRGYFANPALEEIEGLSAAENRIAQQAVDLGAQFSLDALKAWAKSAFAGQQREARASLLLSLAQSPEAALGPRAELLKIQGEKLGAGLVDGFYKGAAAAAIRQERASFLTRMLTAQEGAVRGEAEAAARVGRTVGEQLAGGVLAGMISLQDQVGTYGQTLAGMVEGLGHDLLRSFDDTFFNLVTGRLQAGIADIGRQLRDSVLREFTGALTRAGVRAALEVVLR